MSQTMPIKPTPRKRSIAAPVVDMLCHEPRLGALVAEFIPQPDVSTELKESVYLYDNTASARRVRELLGELQKICGLPNSISKIAHAGGEEFSIYMVDGNLFELRKTGHQECRSDAYAVLQTLGQEIQLEFLLQRRAGQRQAV